MKKIVSFFIAFAIFLFSNAQNYVEIGNGTVETGYPVSYWGYSWYTFILKASDLGGPKTITAIAFNLKAGPKNAPNQKIYVKHTSLNVFPDASYENPENTGYTKVFEGNITYQTGWNVLTFSTPFEYDGTSNLIIHYENRCGNGYLYPSFYSTSSSINNNKSNGNDSSFPTSNGYLNPHPSSVPNVRIYYQSNLPATPDVVSPANNATKVDLNTSLVFTIGANTSSYDVYLSTNQALVTNMDPSAKVASDVAVSAPGQYSFTPASILNPATDYYWRVVAKSGQNSSPSTVWKFTTQNVISTFPYFQGFEGTDVFYPGWYGYYTDWTYPTTSPNNIWNKSNQANAHTGTAALVGAPFSGNPINSPIMTPRIFLPNNHRVSFYWRQGNYNTKDSKDGSSKIYFEITTDGGQTWIALDSIVTQSAQQSFLYVQKDLSAYAGNNVYLRWRYFRSGVENTNPVFIDDILIEENPSGAVIELSTNNITFTTIAQNAHNKKVVYVVNKGTANLVINSINVAAPFSATISSSNIAPNDTAELYVTYNGTSVGTHTATLTINSNGVGQNTISLSGQTVALINSIYETFESVPDEQLPAGWSVIRNVNDQFCNANVKTSSTDAVSGVKVIRMLNANTVTKPLILLTPGVGGFGSNVLKFYAKKTQGNPQQVDLIVGLMDDPDDASTFEPVQTITLTDVQTQYTINFSANNTKPYIAFKHGLLNTWQSIWIDNVQWEAQGPNPPSCAQVVSPQNGAINIYPDVTLKWTPTSSDVTGYYLNIGTNPQNPTDALNHENVGNVTSYQIEDLPYSVTIYWQVIPYNQYGQATGCPVWSFTVMNDPTLTIPWSEGFEDLVPASGFQYPLGWSIVNGNAQNVCWDVIANTPSYPNNAHTGNKAIHISFSFLQPLNDWLITPPIVFEENKNYRLSFWLKAPVYTAGGSSTSEKLRIGIAQSDDTAEMALSIIWNNNMLQLNEYTLQEVDITGLPAGTYFIGFHAYSDPLQWLIYIDDVQMTQLVDVVDNSNVKVSVYPNPFTDFLNISVFDGNSYNVEMYDVNGKIIMQSALTTTFKRFDLSRLDAGLYLMAIKDANGKLLANYKLIKK